MRTGLALTVSGGGGGVHPRRNFGKKRFEKKRKKNLEKKHLETPPKNYRHPPENLETPEKLETPWKLETPPWKIGDPPKMKDTPPKLETPPKNLETPQNWRPPEKWRHPPEKLETPQKIGDTPPWDQTTTTTPLLTESQTRVKILPWPNFVAAGNYPIGELCSFCSRLILASAVNIFVYTRIHSSRMHNAYRPRIDRLGGGVHPRRNFGKKDLEKKWKKIWKKKHLETPHKLETPPLKNWRPPKIKDTPQNWRHPPKIGDIPPEKLETPKKLETPPLGTRPPPPPPSPVNRITDTCKNITLAQLRCGR